MTALTPEAVAQMVAELRKYRAAMFNSGWLWAADTVERAADMLTTLAAENATLREERDGWRNTVGAIAATVPLPRVIAVTGTVHDMVKYFTDLVASEAAAVERVRVLTEAVETQREVNIAAMKFLLGSGRDALLLADQIHRADDGLRAALTPPKTEGAAS